MDFQIRQGEVLEVLRSLPSKAFHAALTDPPYGLSSIEKRSPARKSGVNPNQTGFMGMEWDGYVPDAFVWRELLRTLRPGAHMLAFGGARTHHRLMCAIEDAGFEIRDCLMWVHSQGFPKSANLGNDMGTNLKPAWEPIILAMRPTAGTFDENFQKWSVGGLNIEGCRIQHEDTIRPFATFNDIRNEGYNRKGNGREGEASAERRYSDKGGTNFAAKPGVRGGDPAGRWPANLIFDEEAAAQLDAQTGILKSGANPKRRNSAKFKNTYQPYDGEQCTVHRGGDVGGPSRFFYCAKASSSERDGNIHPTVKPLKLTEWLAKLLLPPFTDEPRRMVVPFCGSGSEMLGSLSAGWESAFGIERDAEYISIAFDRFDKFKLSQNSEAI